MFFDFQLAFTEDLQPGGVNQQMRDFTPGRRFESDADRFCPLTGAAVIITEKRNADQRKNVINKSLSGPQVEQE